MHAQEAKFEQKGGAFGVFSSITHRAQLLIVFFNNYQLNYLLCYARLQVQEAKFEQKGEAYMPKAKPTKKERKVCGCVVGDDDDDV